ncbi:hypothetical protein ABZ413_25330 [Nocardia rhamnosiphila]|uniref:effector-associated constant component EACC1 n=1 Tax=Nocardia rhamnosiphila TaxID=426716 RepID=UPI00340C2BCE
MELLVAVEAADDDVEELHSLFEALLEDDELRQVSKRLGSGPSQTGTLGAEEIIRIVVDSAPLWGALTASVTAWLHMRRPRLNLKITRPDGVTVEIAASGGQVVDATQVNEAIALVRGTTDETP